MAAADHRKALFRSEIGRLRQFADRLLARVDQVGVFVALEGKGTDAEHPVLGLQRHRHPCRHMIRDERRNPDAEVDVIAVLQLLRGARRHIVRSEEHTSELQSLMRISYAVFCLKKKKKEPHEAITNIIES